MGVRYIKELVKAKYKVGSNGVSETDVTKCMVGGLVNLKGLTHILI